MKEYKSNLPEITLKYKTGVQKNVKLNSSKDSFEVMKTFYDQDTIELTESFIVLFLNRGNRTIGWYKLSQGGISGTVVDVRLIFSVSLKCGSSSIIVSHNHPSGNAFPSTKDVKITKNIVEAGKILDITVFDHLIVTNDCLLFLCR